MHRRLPAHAIGVAGVARSVNRAHEPIELGRDDGVAGAKRDARLRDARARIGLLHNRRHDVGIRTPASRDDDSVEVYATSSA